MPNLSSLGFSQEPALYVAVIDAAIMLAVSFGVPLEPAQKTAIDALLAVVAGVVIRSQVSPVASLPAATPSVPPTSPVVS